MLLLSGSAVGSEDKIVHDKYSSVVVNKNGLKLITTGQSKMTGKAVPYMSLSMLHFQSLKSNTFVFDLVMVTV